MVQAAAATLPLASSPTPNPVLAAASQGQHSHVSRWGFWTLHRTFFLHPCRGENLKRDRHKPLGRGMSMDGEQR